MSKKIVKRIEEVKKLQRMVFVEKELFDLYNEKRSLLKESQTSEG